MTISDGLRVVGVGAALLLLGLGRTAGAFPDLCGETCHAPGTSREVKFNSNPQVSSERAWMTDAGTGDRTWVKRGSHGVDDSGQLDDSTCHLCHYKTCVSCHNNNYTTHTDTTVVFPNDPANNPAGTDPWYYKNADFPATSPTNQNCAPACHLWVGTGKTVSQDGFLNLSGDASQSRYADVISPAELLHNGVAAGKKHSNFYYGPDTTGRKGGCAGFCHEGRKAKPGKSPAHGKVASCIDCHSFSWTNTPNPTDVENGNLHLTHVPFVTAEQPLSDPADFQNGSTACQYCHPTIPMGAGNWVFPNALNKRACWNCHLSGHEPITPYFKNGTPALPVSAPPVP